MENVARFTGAKLGQLLSSQGRKASWLATNVGVSQSLISRIISGERFASAALAEKIADKLGVPIGLIFDPVE